MVRSTPNLGSNVTWWHDTVFFTSNTVDPLCSPGRRAERW
jgi:hypothetical protein